MKKLIKKYWPTRRRIMQLYFGLLVNANLKGFLSGKIYSYAAGTKFLCAPGLNCYSCPGASMACPMGALQNSFSAGKSTLAYVGGIILLYGIILGRTICGWICPFGLIQDLLHKIPTRKLKKGLVTRLLSWLKYGILVIFGLLIPIFYTIRKVPLPAFCKFICPAGTLEGGLLLLSHKANSGLLDGLGVLFTWKFLLMVSILVGCVFIYRIFCRFLCPLGALYGLFNKLCFVGVTVDAEKCIQCGLCVESCKVDIRHVGDKECIQCGECIGVCPTQSVGQIRVVEIDFCHFPKFSNPCGGSEQAIHKPGALHIENIVGKHIARHTHNGCNFRVVWFERNTFSDNGEQLFQLLRSGGVHVGKLRNINI